MNLKNYATILLLVFTTSAFAQSIEDDSSILYMKANVLFDSGRYDEAVRMYNRIIGDDDSYAAAYFMRAKSKYELGAYKGTKNDIMDYIEINGVTKSVIKLMSKTEYNLENYDAAKNYVKTALELDPYDAEQYKIGGDIEKALGNNNEACEMWYSASELGNSKSKSQLENSCGIYMKMKKERDQRTSRRDKNKDRKKERDRDYDQAEDEITLEDSLDDDPKSEDDRSESDAQEGTRVEAPDMDAMQEIEIDDELTVVVGNGLGKRRIENQPDIFMLADQSGRVVIDICVDGRGKVKIAELNKDQTTLHKGGLTSLALRKSKEFSFFPSFRQEQCGQFIFMISEGQ